MHEIRGIPGNAAAIERLQRILDSGEGVGFVGAGASAGAYPLWQDLVEQLIVFAAERGLADRVEVEYWREAAQDPIHTLETVKGRLGSQWGWKIRELFAPPTTRSDRFTRLQELLLRVIDAVFPNAQIIATARLEPTLPPKGRGRTIELLRDEHDVWVTTTDHD